MKMVMVCVPDDVVDEVTETLDRHTDGYTSWDYKGAWHGQRERGVVFMVCVEDRQVEPLRQSLKDSLNSTGEAVLFMAILPVEGDPFVALDA